MARLTRDQTHIRAFNVAVRIAAVTTRKNSVVALLSAFLDAIATLLTGRPRYGALVARFHLSTVRGTAIAIRVVPIIAILTGIEHPIAAGNAQLTRSQAYVPIFDHFAVEATTVAGNGVVVVTDLVSIDDAVTAFFAGFSDHRAVVVVFDVPTVRAAAVAALRGRQTRSARQAFSIGGAMRLAVRALACVVTNLPTTQLTIPTQLTGLARQRAIVTGRFHTL
jgi:hypothetical protein